MCDVTKVDLGFALCSSALQGTHTLPDDLAGTNAVDLSGLILMENDDNEGAENNVGDTEGGDSTSARVVELRGGPLTPSQREIIHDLMERHVKTLTRYACEWNKSPETLLKAAHYMVTTKSRRQNGNSWNAFECLHKRGDICLRRQQPDSSLPRTPEGTEAEIRNEYESQIRSLGGKTSPEWKERAAKITEQHSEVTKSVVSQLASDPHIQARNMAFYRDRIKKDMTWAALCGIHMALVMVSATDHPATQKHNGVSTNTAAMEAWFQSICKSNTILFDNIRTFVTQRDGKNADGEFVPPPTPCSRDDCRTASRAHLANQLLAFVVGNNPLNGQFPWGMLPKKLLDAGRCLTQCPDDAEFD
ncbi:uncharacterized protein EI90DRAFT_2595711 [Cantharellus anzutake]|uniref:uncharacterized protein n=1 Tax=Cantharellus anzutake TaxID=1750568 RepID=UPI001908B74B|nr:uncharacterized protein EI90DRAFT_2595711 [Cantharellus anzutake]KAF8321053.1 hypothetical protein EI90DRAFT_2595711 [Cantharellus anzutake]